MYLNNWKLEIWFGCQNNLASKILCNVGADLIAIISLAKKLKIFIGYACSVMLTGNSPKFILMYAGFNNFNIAWSVVK